MDAALDDILRAMGDIGSRIRAKSEATADGCWVWKGVKSKYGYGLIWKDKTMKRVHRLVFEAFSGAAIGHLEVNHKCRNTSCFRPYHLETLSKRDHLKETLRWSNSPVAINARRTSCVQGHPLSGANVINENGRRKCRACRAACKARWRSRKASTSAA